MSEAAEKKIADLERELIGTQEMLGFVLDAIGEPVYVTKAAITEGLGATAQIRVDDDLENNRFVFQLVKE